MQQGGQQPQQAPYAQQAGAQAGQYGQNPQQVGQQAAQQAGRAPLVLDDKALAPTAGTKRTFESLGFNSQELYAAGVYGCMGGWVGGCCFFWLFSGTVSCAASYWGLDSCGADG